MQLKVKDFAAQQGVSESIIYRHIRQHREELGEGVIKKPKATWLTDEAQDYLRGLMVQPPPPVIGDTQTAQELAEAEAEIKRLSRELELALKQRNALSEWKAENAVAIASAAQTQLLLDTTRAELDQERIQRELAENQGREKAQEAAEAVAREQEALQLAEAEKKARQAAEAEAAALRAELARPLTLKERIFGRKGTL